MLAFKIVRFTRPVTALLRGFLPDSLRRRLRGRHHSIEFRFIQHPLEGLGLGLHKLFGGNYLGWYAKRQDSHLKDRYEHWDDIPADYQAWLDGGREDLAVLKHFGLEPRHSLLDYGCGHGLGAKFFVEYLDPGRLVANDASAERLRIVKLQLERRGLDGKNARLICNEDNTLDWLQGRKFDFIWCYAVLEHVPPEDNEQIFGNFRKAMHGGSVCLFSYLPDLAPRESSHLSVKDWAHSFARYAALAGKYGCTVRDETPALNRLGRNSPPIGLIRMQLKP